MFVLTPPPPYIVMPPYRSPNILLQNNFLFFILRQTTFSVCERKASMAVALVPEIGIEIPENLSYMDLRKRAEAACNTINQLEKHGLEVPPPSEIEKDVAATLLNSYAENAEKTSKAVTNSRISSMTPASLVQTHEILHKCLP